MKIKKQVQVQIGKSGLTEGVISNIDSLLFKHRRLKVYLLRGASPTKELVSEYREKLNTGLKTPHKSSSLGFTITLKKVAKQASTVKR